MNLLERGAASFVEHCLEGISVSEEESRRNATALIPYLTELAKQHGYSTISHLCKDAAGDSGTIRRQIGERGWEQGGGS
jgi:aspartate ammonia-lyase